MKKKIAALAIIFCVASTCPAFARGNDHRNYGGNHKRSDYSGHRGGGHNNNGLGIAVGVMGGLLLGSALMYSAPPPPPPPTVVYTAPYPPQVVVQQPRVCVEDQVVTGQWQTSQYNGRRVWVSFPYPVSQRVEVECY